MTCKQFLDALDCYVDGELSAEASAAADAHRRECPSCHRAATRVLDMKAAVRRTVVAGAPPPQLEARVRAVVARRWLERFRVLPPRLAPRPVLAVAALVLLAAVASAVAWTPVGTTTANMMDRLAVHLDGSSAIVLEGTLLCRDCELEHRYGIKASCAVIGHHGAIATADGRIWNIVEQRSSASLIHDESLLGKKVVVRGRLFRGSRAVVVESYQFAS